LYSILRSGHDGGENSRPPLLGFVAEFVHIRASYLVCLPLLLAGLWASSFALGQKKVEAPHGLPAEPLGPNG
jgi:hypothetical protein